MNVGYLVGWDGLVKRSDDDGATWVVKTQPSGGLSLNRISANNANFDEIVVIAFESIFYSTDGGITWNIPIGDWSSSVGGIILYSIKRSKHDQNYIWISGEDKRLYLSTDNGISFNRVNVPNGSDGAIGLYDIIDVEFWDADTGLIIHRSGGTIGTPTGGLQLRKTTNQGVSWSPPLDPAVFSVNSGLGTNGIRTFNNGQIIYVASKGKFYKSVDGGLNFTVNNSAYTNTLGNGAGFFSCPSPSRIYIGELKSSLNRSTDAGLTFTQLDYNGNGAPYGGGDWIDDDNGFYSKGDDVYTDSDGLVTFPTGVTESSATRVTDLIYIAPAPPPPIQGCTDVNACNYNALATIDDGNCDYRYQLTACDGIQPDIVTDSNLIGFLGKTVKFNGICYVVSYYTVDCIVGTGNTIFISRFNVYDDCETCELVYGCTDTNSCNYDPLADVDDGSCL